MVGGSQEHYLHTALRDRDAYLHTYLRGLG